MKQKTSELSRVAYEDKLLGLSYGYYVYLLATAKRSKLEKIRQELEEKWIKKDLPKSKPKIQKNNTNMISISLKKGVVKQFE